MVVFCTTNNNYDQLLLNKPLTNQQPRNCHIGICDPAVLLCCCLESQAGLVKFMTAFDTVGFEWPTANKQANNQEPTTK